MLCYVMLLCYVKTGVVKTTANNLLARNLI